MRSGFQNVGEAKQAVLQALFTPYELNLSTDKIKPLNISTLIAKTLELLQSQEADAHTGFADKMQKAVKDAYAACFREANPLNLLGKPTHQYIHYWDCIFDARLAEPQFWRNLVQSAGALSPPRDAAQLMSNILSAIEYIIDSDHYWHYQDEYRDLPTLQLPLPKHFVHTYTDTISNTPAVHLAPYFHTNDARSNPIGQRFEFEANALNAALVADWSYAFFLKRQKKFLQPNPNWEDQHDKRMLGYKTLDTFMQHVEVNRRELLLFDLPALAARFCSLNSAQKSPTTLDMARKHSTKGPHIFESVDSFNQFYRSLQDAGGSADRLVCAFRGRGPAPDARGVEPEDLIYGLNANYNINKRIGSLQTTLVFYYKNIDEARVQQKFEKLAKVWKHPRIRPNILFIERDIDRDGPLEDPIKAYEESKNSARSTKVSILPDEARITKTNLQADGAAQPIKAYYYAPGLQREARIWNTEYFEKGSKTQEAFQSAQKAAIHTRELQEEEADLALAQAARTQQPAAQVRWGVSELLKLDEHEILNSGNLNVDSTQERHKEVSQERQRENTQQGGLPGEQARPIYPRRTELYDFTEFCDFLRDKCRATIADQSMVYNAWYKYGLAENANDPEINIYKKVAEDEAYRKQFAANIMGIKLRGAGANATPEVRLDSGYDYIIQNAADEIVKSLERYIDSPLDISLWQANDSLYKLESYPDTLTTAQASGVEAPVYNPGRAPNPDNRPISPEASGLRVLNRSFSNYYRQASNYQDPTLIATIFPPVSATYTPDYGALLNKTRQLLHENNQEEIQHIHDLLYSRIAKGARNSKDTELKTNLWAALQVFDKDVHFQGAGSVNMDGAISAFKQYLIRRLAGAQNPTTNQIFQERDFDDDGSIGVLIQFLFLGDEPATHPRHHERQAHMLRWLLLADLTNAPIDFQAFIGALSKAAGQPEGSDLRASLHHMRDLEILNKTGSWGSLNLDDAINSRHSTENLHAMSFRDGKIEKELVLQHFIPEQAFPNVDDNEKQETQRKRTVWENLLNKWVRSVIAHVADKERNLNLKDAYKLIQLRTMKCLDMLVEHEIMQKQPISSRGAERGKINRQANIKALPGAMKNFRRIIEALCKEDGAGLNVVDGGNLHSIMQSIAVMISLSCENNNLEEQIQALEAAAATGGKLSLRMFDVASAMMHSGLKVVTPEMQIELQKADSGGYAITYGKLSELIQKEGGAPEHMTFRYLGGHTQGSRGGASIVQYQKLYNSHKAKFGEAGSRTIFAILALNTSGITNIPGAHEEPGKPGTPGKVRFSIDYEKAAEFASGLNAAEKDTFNTLLTELYKQQPYANFRSLVTLAQMGMTQVRGQPRQQPQQAAAHLAHFYSSLGLNADKVLTVLSHLQLGQITPMAFRQAGVFATWKRDLGEKSLLILPILLAHNLDLERFKREYGSSPGKISYIADKLADIQVNQKLSLHGDFLEALEQADINDADQAQQFITQHILNRTDGPNIQFPERKLGTNHTSLCELFEKAGIKGQLQVLFQNAELPENSLLRKKISLTNTGLKSFIKEDYSALQSEIQRYLQDYPQLWDSAMQQVNKLLLCGLITKDEPPVHAYQAAEVVTNLCGNRLERDGLLNQYEVYYDLGRQWLDYIGKTTLISEAAKLKMRADAKSEEEKAKINLYRAESEGVIVRRLASIAASYASYAAAHNRSADDDHKLSLDDLSKNLKSIMSVLLNAIDLNARHRALEPMMEWVLSMVEKSLANTSDPFNPYKIKLVVGKVVNFISVTGCAKLDERVWPMLMKLANPPESFLTKLLTYARQIDIPPGEHKEFDPTQLYGGEFLNICAKIDQPSGVVIDKDRQTPIYDMIGVVEICERMEDAWPFIKALDKQYGEQPEVFCKAISNFLDLYNKKKDLGHIPLLVQLCNWLYSTHHKQSPGDIMEVLAALSTIRPEHIEGIANFIHLYGTVYEKSLQTYEKCTKDLAEAENAVPRNNAKIEELKKSLKTAEKDWKAKQPIKQHLQQFLDHDILEIAQKAHAGTDVTLILQQKLDILHDTMYVKDSSYLKDTQDKLSAQAKLDEQCLQTVCTYINRLDNTFIVANLRAAISITGIVSTEKAAGLIHFYDKEWQACQAKLTAAQDSASQDRSNDPQIQAELKHALAQAQREADKAKKALDTFNNKILEIIDKPNISDITSGIEGLHQAAIKGYPHYQESSQQALKQYHGHIRHKISKIVYRDPEGGDSKPGSKRGVKHEKDAPPDAKKLQKEEENILYKDYKLIMELVGERGVFASLDSSKPPKCAKDLTMMEVRRHIQICHKQMMNGNAAQIHEAERRLLALSCVAVHRTTGKFPRLEQVLSTLTCMLLRSNNFQEIDTGEGKTLTGTLGKTWQWGFGDTVVMLTQNQFLAEAAIREYAPYYKYVNIPYGKTPISSANMDTKSFLVGGINTSTADDFTTYWSFMLGMGEGRMLERVVLNIDEADTTTTPTPPTNYCISMSVDPDYENLEFWQLVYETSLDFMQEQRKAHDEKRPVPPDLVSAFSETLDKKIDQHLKEDTTSTRRNAFLSIKRKKLDIDPLKINALLTESLLALCIAKLEGKPNGYQDTFIAKSSGEGDSSMDTKIVRTAAPVDASGNAHAHLSLSGFTQNLLHTLLNKKVIGTKYNISPITDRIQWAVPRNILDMVNASTKSKGPIKYICISGTGGPVDETKRNYNITTLKLPRNQNKQVKKNYIVCDTIEEKFPKIIEQLNANPHRATLVLLGSIDEADRFYKLLNERDHGRLIQKCTGQGGASIHYTVELAGGKGVITIATDLFTRGVDIVPEDKENGLFLIDGRGCVSISNAIQGQGRAGRGNVPGDVIELICAEEIQQGFESYICRGSANSVLGAIENIGFTKFENQQFRKAIREVELLKEAQKKKVLLDLLQSYHLDSDIEAQLRVQNSASILETIKSIDAVSPNIQQFKDAIKPIEKAEDAEKKRVLLNLLAELTSRDTAGRKALHDWILAQQKVWTEEKMSAEMQEQAEKSATSSAAISSLDQLFRNHPFVAEAYHAQWLPVEQKEALEWLAYQIVHGEELIAADRAYEAAMKAVYASTNWRGTKPGGATYGVQKEVERNGYLCGMKLTDYPKLLKDYQDAVDTFSLYREQFLGIKFDSQNHTAQTEILKTMSTNLGNLLKQSPKDSASTGALAIAWAAYTAEVTELLTAIDAIKNADKDTIFGDNRTAVIAKKRPAWQEYQDAVYKFGLYREQFLGIKFDSRNHTTQTEMLNTMLDQLKNLLTKIPKSQVLTNSWNAHAIALRELYSDIQDIQKAPAEEATNNRATTAAAKQKKWEGYSLKHPIIRQINEFTEKTDELKNVYIKQNLFLKEAKKKLRDKPVSNNSDAAIQLVTELYPDAMSKYNHNRSPDHEKAVTRARQQLASLPTNFKEFQKHWAKYTAGGLSKKDKKLYSEARKAHLTAWRRLKIQTHNEYGAYFNNSATLQDQHVTQMFAMPAAYNEEEIRKLQQSVNGSIVESEIDYNALHSIVKDLAEASIEIASGGSTMFKDDLRAKIATACKHSEVHKQVEVLLDNPGMAEHYEAWLQNSRKQIITDICFSIFYGVGFRQVYNDLLTSWEYDLDDINLPPEQVTALSKYYQKYADSVEYLHSLDSYQGFASGLNTALKDFNTLRKEIIDQKLYNIAGPLDPDIQLGNWKSRCGSIRSSIKSLQNRVDGIKHEFYQEEPAFRGLIEHYLQKCKSVCEQTDALVLSLEKEAQEQNINIGAPSAPPPSAPSTSAVASFFGGLKTKIEHTIQTGKHAEKVATALSLAEQIQEIERAVPVPAFEEIPFAMFKQYTTAKQEIQQDVAQLRPAELERLSAQNSMQMTSSIKDMVLVARNQDGEDNNQVVAKIRINQDIEDAPSIREEVGDYILNESIHTAQSSSLNHGDGWKVLVAAEQINKTCRQANKYKGHNGGNAAYQEFIDYLLPYTKAEGPVADGIHASAQSAHYQAWQNHKKQTTVDKDGNIHYPLASSLGGQLLSSQELKILFSNIGGGPEALQERVESSILSSQKRKQATVLRKRLDLYNKFMNPGPGDNKEDILTELASEISKAIEETSSANRSKTAPFCYVLGVLNFILAQKVAEKVKSHVIHVNDYNRAMAYFNNALEAMRQNTQAELNTLSGTPEEIHEQSVKRLMKDGMYILNRAVSEMYGISVNISLDEPAAISENIEEAAAGVILEIPWSAPLKRLAEEVKDDPEATAKIVSQAQYYKALREQLGLKGFLGLLGGLYAQQHIVEIWTEDRGFWESVIEWASGYNPGRIQANIIQINKKIAKEEKKIRDIEADLYTYKTAATLLVEWRQKVTNITSTATPEDTAVILQGKVDAAWIAFLRDDNPYYSTNGTPQELEKQWVEYQKQQVTQQPDRSGELPDIVTQREAFIRSLTSRPLIQEEKDNEKRKARTIIGDLQEELHKQEDEKYRQSANDPVEKVMRTEIQKFSKEIRDLKAGATGTNELLKKLSNALDYCADMEVEFKEGFWPGLVLRESRYLSAVRALKEDLSQTKEKVEEYKTSPEVSKIRDLADTAATRLADFENLLQRIHDEKLQDVGGDNVSSLHNKYLVEGAQAFIPHLQKSGEIHTLLLNFLQKGELKIKIPRFLSILRQVQNNLFRDIRGFALGEITSIAGESNAASTQYAKLMSEEQKDNLSGALRQTIKQSVDALSAKLKEQVDEDTPSITETAQWKLGIEGARSYGLGAAVRNDCMKLLNTTFNSQAMQEWSKNILQEIIVGRIDDIHETVKQRQFKPFNALYLTIPFWLPVLTNIAEMHYKRKAKAANREEAAAVEQDVVRIHRILSITLKGWSLATSLAKLENHPNPTVKDVVHVIREHMLKEKNGLIGAIVDVMILIGVIREQDQPKVSEAIRKFTISFLNKIEKLYGDISLKEMFQILITKWLELVRLLFDDQNFNNLWSTVKRASLRDNVDEKDIGLIEIGYQKLQTAVVGLGHFGEDVLNKLPADAKIPAIFALSQGYLEGVFRDLPAETSFNQIIDQMPPQLGELGELFDKHFEKILNIAGVTSGKPTDQATVPQPQAQAAPAQQPAANNNARAANASTQQAQNLISQLKPIVPDIANKILPIMTRGLVQRPSVSEFLDDLVAPAPPAQTQEQPTNLQPQPQPQVQTQISLEDGINEDEFHVLAPPPQTTTAAATSSTPSTVSTVTVTTTTTPTTSATRAPATTTTPAAPTISLAALGEGPERTPIAQWPALTFILPALAMGASQYKSVSNPLYSTYEMWTDIRCPSSMSPLPKIIEQLEEGIIGKIASAVLAIGRFGDTITNFIPSIKAGTLKAAKGLKHELESEFDDKDAWIAQLKKDRYIENVYSQHDAEEIERRKIINNCKAEGITNPTEIQERIISEILKYRKNLPDTMEEKITDKAKNYASNKKFTPEKTDEYVKEKISKFRKDCEEFPLNSFAEPNDKDRKKEENKLRALEEGRDRDITDQIAKREARIKDVNDKGEKDSDIEIECKAARNILRKRLLAKGFMKEPNEESAAIERQHLAEELVRNRVIADLKTSKSTEDVTNTIVTEIIKYRKTLQVNVFAGAREERQLRQLEADRITYVAKEMDRGSARLNDSEIEDKASRYILKQRLISAGFMQDGKLIQAGYSVHLSLFFRLALKFFDIVEQLQDGLLSLAGAGASIVGAIGGGGSTILGLLGRDTSAFENLKTMADQLHSQLDGVKTTLDQAFKLNQYLKEEAGLEKAFVYILKSVEALQKDGGTEVKVADFLRTITSILGYHQTLEEKSAEDKKSDADKKLENRGKPPLLNEFEQAVHEILSSFINNTFPFINAGNIAQVKGLFNLAAKYINQDCTAKDVVDLLGKFSRIANRGNEEKLDAVIRDIFGKFMPKEFDTITFPGTWGDFKGAFTILEDFLKVDLFRTRRANEPTYVQECQNVLFNRLAELNNKKLAQSEIEFLGIMAMTLTGFMQTAPELLEFADQTIQKGDQGGLDGILQRTLKGIEIGIQTLTKEENSVGGLIAIMRQGIPPSQKPANQNEEQRKQEEARVQANNSIITNLFAVQQQMAAACFTPSLQTLSGDQLHSGKIVTNPQDIRNIIEEQHNLEKKHEEIQSGDRELDEIESSVADRSKQTKEKNLIEVNVQLALPSEKKKSRPNYVYPGMLFGSTAAATLAAGTALHFGLSAGLTSVELAAALTSIYLIADIATGIAKSTNKPEVNNRDTVLQIAGSTTMRGASAYFMLASTQLQALGTIPMIASIILVQIAITTLFGAISGAKESQSRA